MPRSRNQTATETAPADTVQPDSLDISISIGEMAPKAMRSLIRILYARQRLLAAMVKNSGIRIDDELIDLLDDEKPDTLERISELVQNEIRVGMVKGIQLTSDSLGITVPGAEHSQEEIVIYARLLDRILERARGAGNVSHKLIDPAEDEMKYYCYSFLTQLGMNGPEHSAHRRLLTGHLKGYAAFRSKAQLDAHIARITARRRAQRETIQAPADLEAGDGE
jgi:hypothetical protein